MLPLRLSTRYAWVAEFIVIYLAPAALINVGNAAAYLFQLIAGRQLTVSDYGGFNALLSAVLIASAPANVLPLIVTHLALPLHGDLGMQRELAERCLKWATRVGVGLTIIGACALPALAHSLGVTWTAVAIAILTVVASLFQPITVGLTQARRQYVPAAIIQGANPALRLAIGLVLVLAYNGGLAAAMASVALPVALTFGLGMIFLRDLRHQPRRALPVQVGEVWRRSTLRQVVSVTGFAMLSNLDVILAKLLLPSDEAGLYAGAAVISRIALLLPSALSGVIFSESARRQAKGSSPRRVLVELALSAALAAPAVLLFATFGPSVLRLLLGPRFVPVGDVLRLTGCSMGLLSLSQAAAMSLAGRGSFRYLWGLVGLTLLMAAVAPFAVYSAMTLAELTLVFNLALALVAGSLISRHHP